MSHMPPAIRCVIALGATLALLPSAVANEPESGATAPEPPRDTSPLDAPRPELADDAPDRFPRRATLVSYRAGRLRQTDDWSTGSDKLEYGREHVVVDVHGATVRIIDSHYGIRLLVEVKRTDLEPRLARTTRIVSDPVLVEEAAATIASADSYVEVAGGQRVETVDTRDAARRVVLEEGSLDVEGWVPSDAVDEVYEPVTFYVSTDVEARLTGASAALKTSPSGGDLLRFGAGAGAHIDVRGDARDGAVPVRITTENVRATGWIDSDAIEIVDPAIDLGNYGTMSAGGMGGWGCGCCNSVYLDRGTVLYTSPGGEAVGIVERSQALVILQHERDDGWSRVSFPTEWGDFELWVPPSAENERDLIIY